MRSRRMFIVIMIILSILLVNPQLSESSGNVVSRSNFQQINGTEASKTYSWDTNTQLEVTTNTDSLNWWTNQNHYVTLTFRLLELGDGVNRLYDLYFSVLIATLPYAELQGPVGPFELNQANDFDLHIFEFKIVAEAYDLDTEGKFWSNIDIQYKFMFTLDINPTDKVHKLSEWESDLALTYIAHPYSPQLDVNTTFSSLEILEGEVFTFNVIVENGDPELLGLIRPATGVVVHLLFPDGGLSTEHITDNLGEVIDVSETPFKIQTDLSGLYSIHVGITATNADSANTVEYVKVLVPPQFSLTANLSPNSTISEGESVPLIIEIINNEDLLLENVNITITLPEGLSTSQSIRTVGDIQTTEQETFSITGDVPGSYMIGIKVEATAQGNPQTKTTTIELIVEEPPPPVTTQTTQTTQTIPEFDSSVYITIIGLIMASILINRRKN